MKRHNRDWLAIVATGLPASVCVVCCASVYDGRIGLWTTKTKGEI